MNFLNTNYDCFWICQYINLRILRNVQIFYMNRIACAKFARIAGKDYIFDATAAAILEEKLGETTPIMRVRPAAKVKG